MVWVLCGCVIVLVLLHLFQFQRMRQRNDELLYITNKLKDMEIQHSTDPILVVTNEQSIQHLLVQLNMFIESYQGSKAAFRKTEDAFKKMLANISHDLKTPLTVVLGYIETIQKDPKISEAERERILQNIHSKTLEIIQLMNSFFDLAKLEAGDIQLLMERVNVNEVCRKSILSFYDVMQAQGLEADIDIPDTPVYALANEEALERILNNLLSNALHYGNAGKVIGIQLRFTEQRLVINVWDRGKGIEETHQNRVFERLFTLDESRNKAFQGSGLGLTITKRLVEAIGGVISLQSKPYEKTVFSIQLKRMTY
ncbi:sensor histidine kinase [Bacillus sp. Bva_UNVM-123]|uniref:sensor histidine kinase n=1 Tax=Bacillus sp. Bva_UNVM-123 TaxID=2829798 RepID=UPI00391F2908